ncbi:FMRFamide receptor-like [Liolophura sinensis]|uniref:FMRFamide receptor-like n=1 Tax=Liolophura sinensis TaxID=3198878 RepID=UPI003158A83C
MASTAGETNSTNSTNFVETEIAEGIWKYCSFVLIGVGTVGNVLAIFVLLRKNMRSSTTMFYLTVLAFADIVVLYTGLLRYWVKYVFEHDLRAVTTASCRVHLFLVYFSLDAAVWTMVVVTIDRAIFVCWPFRAKTFCTLRNARFVLAALIVVLGLVNVHFLWMIDIIVTDTGVVDCEVQATLTGRQYWYAKVFHPWLDFCMFSFLPFSLMLVCNCLIIRQMALSRRRLAAHAKRQEEKATNVEIPTASNSRRISRKSRRLPRYCSSVTVTLLTVNMVFLLSTSPIVVFLLGHDKWYDHGSAHARAVLGLIWAIVNMLQYLNNAIHFFLYCLTGPKFRRELVLLLRRKNKVDIIVEQSTTLEIYHTNTPGR